MRQKLQQELQAGGVLSCFYWIGQAIHNEYCKSCAKKIV